MSTTGTLRPRLRTLEAGGVGTPRVEVVSELGGVFITPPSEVVSEIIDLGILKREEQVDKEGIGLYEFYTLAD